VESHKTLILRGTPRQYVAPGDHLRVSYEETPLPQRPPQQEANLDLVDLWAILLRNKWWIIFVGVLTFIIVLALTLRSQMEFASSGRLYLGEISPITSARNETLDISGDSQSDLSSEMEILRSRSLVKQAILDSGINIEIRVAGAEPMQFYEWLQSGRDLSRLDKAARELVATGNTLREDEREPRTFHVRFITDVSFEIMENGVRLGGAHLGEELNAGDLRLTLVPGKLHRPSAGSRYDLVAHPLPSLTEAVLKELTVTAPDAKTAAPAKVVTLDYTHQSPYAAARFLSRLMECYLEERQTWKVEDATAAENFITQQLNDLRQSLNEVEERVSNFRSQNRVVALEEEAQALVTQLGDYEQKRVAARLQVASLEHLKSQLKSPNPQTEAFMVGEAVNEDSVLEGLAASLAQSKVRLDELKFRLQESAPQLQDQRAQVNSHLTSIQNYVDSRLGRAREELNNLNSVVNQYEAKLRSVPQAERKMAQLARESEVYSSTYSYLLQRQQEAAMIKASNVSKNRVLDQPQVATRESSPKLPLRLASGPLGLILGALMVLIGSLFNGKLQSENEVKRLIGRIPMLARIPRRFRSRMHKIRPVLIDTNTAGMNVGFIEAMRTLRANLYYLGPTDGGTVLLFTSPSSGDGKTTCVLALASMLAADGKKVLLVDADLHKPTHHKLLLSSDPVLPNKDKQEPIEPASYGWASGAQPISGSFGTFHSLRAHDNSPAEILSGSEMERFLGQMRAAYDYILFDCAAYPLVSDALILAGHADLCVSVLRLNKTKRQHATDHLRGLARSLVPQAVIVNDAGSLQSYADASYS